MSRVTLPIEKGAEELVLKLIDLWGADALRNSDGTKLNDFFEELDAKIYSTYFCIREDQEWPRKNIDEIQNMALISEKKIAYSNELEIELLETYYKEQLKINEKSLKYLQVIDRTTNEEVKNFKYKDGVVYIYNAIKFHEYSVNFFANQIWDITHMYNHLTNGWKVEKSIPYDVIYENTRNHLYNHLDEWCKKNEKVDVVRFTTFFYHFTVTYNQHIKQKFGDWFGYSGCVSPKMFEDYKKETGNDICLEDIIDNGYYNNQFRNPSKKFLDFIDYVQRFVSEIAKKCVEIVHKNGKEAMMFIGDNWIGTEPYGKYFKDINLDAVVGSAECGVDIRMVSDMDVKLKEIRFLPYLFPDTFYEGNKPHLEWEYNWMRSRRAILTKKVDRIGFGGYLSLASKFDKFIESVSKSCKEFEDIHKYTPNEESKKSKYKIAILNSWGKIKSWQSNRTGHASGIKENKSYIGVLEILSGLPYEIDFINFDDVKNKNILSRYSIIINVGEENTAFSGGINFNNVKVLENIREWVYNGNIFIGIGDPSMYDGFKLKDILGVDKEIGNTLQYSKYIKETYNDITNKIEIGNRNKYIYPINEKVKIYQNNPEFGVEFSINEYGKGKGIYLQGLVYSVENTRNFYNILQNVTEKAKYLSDNDYVEIYEYEKYLAVINNKDEDIVTNIYNLGEVKLKRYELKWIEK